MTTGGTAEGWYPDPSGGAGLRWWDGRVWTEHTHAGPGYGWAAPGDDRAAAPGWGDQPYGRAPGPAHGQPSPQAGGGWGQEPGPGALGPSTPGRLTASGLWAANRYSFVAVIVSAVYLALALLAHLTLIGFVPLLMSLRAFRARERLAPVALAAAVVVLIVAVASLG